MCCPQCGTKGWVEVTVTRPIGAAPRDSYTVRERRTCPVCYGVPPDCRQRFGKLGWIVFLLWLAIIFFSFAD